MKAVYLALAIVGGIVPYIFFFRFMGGPDPTLANFTAQLFATPAAGGFTSDLLITSVAFWAWSFGETRQLRMGRWWAYVAANLLIGLSFAFPLFLYVREGKTSSSRASGQP